MAKAAASAVIVTQVIRDYKLIVIVNLLSVIDLVILSTWQIVDPPFRIVKELLPQVSLLVTCTTWA